MKKNKREKYQSSLSAPVTVLEYNSFVVPAQIEWNYKGFCTTEPIRHKLSTFGGEQTSIPCNVQKLMIFCVYSENSLS